MKIEVLEYDRSKDFQQVLDLFDDRTLLEIRFAEPIWTYLIHGSDNLFWDALKPEQDPSMNIRGKLGYLATSAFYQVLITSDIVIKNSTEGLPLSEDYYMIFFLPKEKPQPKPVDLLALAQQVTTP